MSLSDSDFPDSSGIYLKIYDSSDTEHTLSPILHQHGCYELMLLTHGRCEYLQGSLRTPLIPGDCLLIPPNQKHAYSNFGSTVSFCCQFSDYALQRLPSDLLQNMLCFGLNVVQENFPSQKRLQELHAFEHEINTPEEDSFFRSDNLNFQDVFHLSVSETQTVYLHLNDILHEQNERPYGFASMKRLILEELLILLHRIRIRQYETLKKKASWKEDLINSILTQIDGDLSCNINFNCIATQHGITLAYFRMIFKEKTGLSPTDYLNRMRIRHALELLQTTDHSVSEVASEVGIYDSNYFSRLFKKITGYPPTYFKSISPDR